MKKLLSVFFVLSITALFAVNTQAQCKGFAKNICKLDLIPYIHDGNYHAAILAEGEEAELYKTFYSGQDYRIAVCGSDAIPEIEFKVVDANRNVVYSNKEHNMSKTWDFNLESSQQLKIVVVVPVKDDKEPEFHSGCVAIMFGFKDE